MIDLPSLVLYVVFHRLFLRVTSSMVPGSCFINPFKASPQALPLSPGCVMDLFSYPFISVLFPAELIRVFQGYREFYDPARITGRKI